MDQNTPESTATTEQIIVDESAELLAKELYDRTAASRVTGQKELLLRPPAGTEKDRIAALLGAIGTADAHPALASIAIVDGKKDRYFYDGSIMTPQYAKVDALLTDKDILSTIASVTRTDSKTYPRPTPFYKLSSYPFHFSNDEILGAVARMKLEEQYKDIGMVSATNGKSALYSELYMSAAYARSLFQQAEVDDRENP